MAKEEWGTKRVCPKCTVRFYDLKNDPMKCPICEAQFELSEILEVNKKPIRESTQEKAKFTAAVDPITQTEDLVDDPIILDDDDTGIELEDELLESDDDESVSLEEIADVTTEDDEN